MTPVTLGIALVMLSTIAEGFAQVCLKKSVLPKASRAIWIAVAVVLFAVEAVIYTGALRILEVSTAFALGSLGVVTVALLAKWFLHERIPPMRWAGILLILVGCGLLSVNA
jgi:undecaprenyl phosphate-alpha-L-ara4N flippase subunit ArnE